MSAAKVIKETSRSRNGMSLPLLSKFEHDCLKTWDSAHQAWSTVFMGAYKHFHTSAHWQPEKHPRRRPSEGPYIGGSKNQNASYPYIGTLSIHWNASYPYIEIGGPYIGMLAIHTSKLEVHTSEHAIHTSEDSPYMGASMYGPSSDVWTCLYAPSFYLWNTGLETMFSKSVLKFWPSQ